MKQLIDTWDTADHEVLLELCRAARVSELLANLPFRQISSGFQKKLQAALDKMQSKQKHNL